MAKRSKSAEYARRWREKHAEELHDIQARYRETHKAQIKANSAKYYERHKEKIDEKGKAYQEGRRRAAGIPKHVPVPIEIQKNKRKENKQRWIDKHPGIGKEMAKQYRESHKEEIRRKQDTEEFRDYMRRATHKRRARLASVGGDYTQADISNLFTKQGGKCAACKERLRKSGKGKFHIDHVIPISKGGCNDPSNLALLCPFCNWSKNDQHPDDWAKEHGLLFC